MILEKQGLKAGKILRCKNPKVVNGFHEYNRGRITSIGMDKHGIIVLTIDYNDGAKWEVPLSYLNKSSAYEIDYYGALCIELLDRLPPNTSNYNTPFSLNMNTNTFNILLDDARMCNYITEIGSPTIKDYFINRILPILRIKNEPNYNTYFSPPGERIYTNILVTIDEVVPLGVINIVDIKLEEYK